jgi:methenyltetrahydrofolate cyclohydrolase
MNTRGMTIESYLDVFGSNAPVPGGGGATAVIGGLACSACMMVCALTMGKKKFAAIEGEVEALNDRVKGIREEFLRLADADAEAFEPLSRAYSNKDVTDDEMDGLLETAGNVPLRIMELGVALLADIRYMTDNGSKLAVSDAKCAFNMAETVIKNGAILVECNTRLMKNRERAAGIDAKVEQFLAQYRDYLVK